MGALNLEVCKSRVCRCEARKNSRADHENKAKLCKCHYLPIRNEQVCNVPSKDTSSLNIDVNAMAKEQINCSDWSLYWLYEKSTYKQTVSSHHAILESVADFFLNSCEAMKPY